MTVGQQHHHARQLLQPSRRTALQRSFRLEGELDVPSFLDSVRALVQRHEALRVAFVPTDEGFRQTSMPMPSAERLINCQRVDGATEERFDAYVRAVLAKDILAFWGDGEDYPFRFRLIRMSANLHVFMVTVQHAVIDLRGMGVLEGDLWSHYQGRRLLEPTLDATGKSIHGFLEAACQQQQVVERLAARNGRFWKNRLRSVQSRFDVSSVGPMGQHFEEIYRIEINFSPQERGSLERIASMTSSTVFQLLLSIFASTAFSLTDQRQIVINMPFDIRQRANAGTLGMFATSLPVVVDRKPTAEALRREVRDSVLRTAMHGHISPGTLVDSYGHDLNQIPLHSQVQANYVDVGKATAPPRIPDLTVDMDYYKPRFRPLAPALYMQVASHFDESLKVELIANSSSIGAVAAGRMAHRFHGLAKKLAN
ncbi:condensation domain-containing protein [Streptomyces xanthochromogenes]|uniref:condensation domain-containing protein n=1 Tax=Streptomyces xanthochromogenes TaxID=67384 RepID=UPI0034325C61